MKPIDALESAITEFDLSFKTPNVSENNSEGKFFFITLDNLILFLEDYRKNIVHKQRQDEWLKHFADKEEEEEEEERRTPLFNGDDPAPIPWDAFKSKCTCAEGEPCSNCQEAEIIFKEHTEPITKDFLTIYLSNEFEAECRGLFGKPKGALNVPNLFVCYEIELKGYKSIEAIGKYCGLNNSAKIERGITKLMNDVAPAFIKFLNGFE